MIRCLGYFLGQSSVWLMCAQALAVFDISKYVENGVEITPEFKLVGETIACVPDVISLRGVFVDARFDLLAIKHHSNVRSKPDQ